MGHDFELIFGSVGIFAGFLPSQIFCKSRGINVTINRKERQDSARNLYLEE